MFMSNEIRSDVPFSLVCICCDAGMGIESNQQALAAGWTAIEFAPDLPMANYLGVCPDCRPAWTGDESPANSE
jgi:ribosomal protein L31